MTENPTRLDTFNTHPEDELFHTTRRMFWVINNQLILANAGSALSHIEFAEQSALIPNNGSRESFLQDHVRGFSLQHGNTPKIHFYRGEFQFDDTVKAAALSVLPQLVQELHLPTETVVVLGPKDPVIHGKEFTSITLGTVGELLLPKDMSVK